MLLHWISVKDGKGPSAAPRADSSSSPGSGPASGVHPKAGGHRETADQASLQIAGLKPLYRDPRASQVGIHVHPKGSGRGPAPASCRISTGATGHRAKQTLASDNSWCHRRVFRAAASTSMPRQFVPAEGAHHAPSGVPGADLRVGREGHPRPEKAEGRRTPPLPPNEPNREGETSSVLDPLHYDNAPCIQIHLGLGSFLPAKAAWEIQ